MLVKRLWILILVGSLLFGMTTFAKEGEPARLYAQSAVLMDADSGRVLFEKNGYEQRAMASTTKIMTCILTLENADLDEVVTVSENAVRQPKVHLGMRKEEQFYLRDLLYSLMLESHNDSAVAIAEHVKGSVEAFASLMNAKAMEIGCEQTYFITPNGLDASDDKGVHSTTAVDLARIMRYCIKESPQKEVFLEITRTSNHSFSNLKGSRNFSCTNHNAFLGMMDGALTGKTGFTSDAGYCYVGALERDGETYVVALLACGWPNNKNYKWSDTKKLMQYGLDYYDYREVYEKINLQEIPVEDGIPENGRLFGKAGVKVMLRSGEDESMKLLLHSEEQVERKLEIEDVLQAPVKAGEQVGKVTYCLEGSVVKEYPIVTMEDVYAKSFLWYLKKVVGIYAI